MPEQKRRVGMTQILSSDYLQSEGRFDYLCSLWARFPGKQGNSPSVFFAWLPDPYRIAALPSGRFFLHTLAIQLCARHLSLSSRQIPVRFYREILAV